MGWGLVGLLPVCRPTGKTKEVYLYNCKRCKRASRVEYPERDASGWYRIGESGRQRPGAWRDCRGNHGEPLAVCPKCARAMDGAPIKGTYSEKHKCDDRCMSARGPNCECSCGGANHGKGWA